MAKAPAASVTELGIVTLVILQLPNAYMPILVTELGIVRFDDSEVQSPNAFCPILVTELGIVTLVILVLLWNANMPILVTLYVTELTIKLAKMVIAPVAFGDDVTVASELPTF